MTSAPTLVLIVEDEPAIAELVKFSLRDDGWNCVAVSTATEAWEFIQCRSPQLILLDSILPERSALHLLLRIRREGRLNGVPVIMLSAKTLEQDKLNGLDSGADDFVTKPFSPRELCARAKALLRRTYQAPEGSTIRVANVVLDPLSHSVRVDGTQLVLALAEYRLLQFLMSHPGVAFSRHELRDKLWHGRRIVDERSVDVNVQRLRKAMREARVLIKTVRHIGYMLAEA
jgi:two-component system phosphate regulon response regulator PhoB